jgi:hypothetical protein
MGTKRIFGLAALIAAVGAMTVAPIASAAPPLRLEFSKQAVEQGVWKGTVSGDIDGGLTTRAIAVDTSDPVWRVTFDWIVDAGMQSFTARLSGTLDSVTGAVAMKGRVVEGYLLGAKVREKGQLVDPETLGFQGSITVIRPGPGR